MTDIDQSPPSGASEQEAPPSDQPRRTRTRSRRGRGAPEAPAASPDRVDPADGQGDSRDDAVAPARGADVAPASIEEASAELPPADEEIADATAQTPASDDAPVRRRRRGRRRGSDEPGTQNDPEAADPGAATGAGSAEQVEVGAGAGGATDDDVAVDDAAVDDVAADDVAVDDIAVDPPVGIDPDAEAVAEDDTDDGAGAPVDATDGEASGQPRRSSRSSRRRGRGRGRRGSRGGSRGTATPGEEDTASDDDAPQAPAADGSAQVPPPTRPPVNARSGRGTRSVRARTAAAPARQRRPLGGVSEETRRAVTEGPPRRMFVTVGEERTQIAVLEERQLVEHYVTRRSDVSYVGNIYLGRVQNVLPGMEAAFIDIGKGRNGVLYAGEVNYDEADLEGELPRIEQTLKPGQPVLVQVTKDPMGTKGARLTQHLSVAGRYCVLAPGDGMLGISRKLTDDERERLREILKDIRPEGFGLIVRTAAEGATREQLQADVARLVRLWDSVTERADRAKPLESVYSEPDLVIRVIRDVFGSEYSELIVDSEELATQVRDYLRDVSPEFVDKVAVHSGEDHIFDAYEVTNQIRRALERKVWLKSGGYLIVEKTEAMWIIDVNTGKFVGERNLEETVLKNNIEAAVEIARQLRLRDMGGIIVIDFVDMLVPANRDEVLKRFKRELARDKTKSRVMEISKLGLVQMTRKNVSQGLQESFTTKCDVCEGRGARIVESIV